MVTQNLSTTAQKLTVGNGDTVILPPIGSVSDEFVCQILPVTAGASYTVQPSSGQTINGTPGNFSATGPVSVGVGMPGNDWTIDAIGSSAPANPFNSNQMPMIDLSSVLNGALQMAASPDGNYVYVSGQLIEADSYNYGVVKVNAKTGAIEAVFNSGAANVLYWPTISPDGTTLYAFTSTGESVLTAFVIATASMTLSGTHVMGSVLEQFTAGNARPFDLSPDGSTIAYIKGDSNVYLMDTTAFAITSFATTESEVENCSICFASGNSSGVAVAVNGSAAIGIFDTESQSSIGTINTGLGGTPEILMMRAGANNTLFAYDNQSLALVAAVAGTPTIYPLGSQVFDMQLNVYSPIAIDYGVDMCLLTATTNTETGTWISVPAYATFQNVPLPMPIGFPVSEQFQTTGVWLPDNTGRFYVVGGFTSNAPNLCVCSTYFPTSSPGALANVLQSDGQGGAFFGVPIFPKGVHLSPITAPANPSNGFVIYVDAGDSNKLKCKSSLGTVTTLATA